MNFEKFSDRARGFVQAAQTIAMRENHQRFLPDHLLKALLDDEQGLAGNLIRAAGGDPGIAYANVEAELGKRAEQRRRDRQQSPRMAPARDTVMPLALDLRQDSAKFGP